MAEGKLDALCDISLGAFLALKRRNPNIVAWRDSLPYAWLDPCPRNLEFNCTREPWNDKDMRWAINYAIDRGKIVSIAYEGTTLPSIAPFPLYPPLVKYIDLARQAGLYEKYPVDKYDTTRARRIIESKGYKIGKNGYYEKNGKILDLEINIPESFIEKQRISQIIVEQLQSIGINATSRNMANGTWTEEGSYGRFTAQVGWGTCSSVNEPWSTLDAFNARWALPAGQRADLNHWRWKNQAFSTIVDSMGVLPLNDPKIEGLFIRAMEIWLNELPIIPLTQARKLNPFNTTYWTGWPTEKNNYIHMPTWWQSAHRIIHNLRPAGH
jgi:peptide/nickel transport system substrate-binding protein